jgi:hypothetical protein
MGLMAVWRIILHQLRHTAAIAERALDALDCHFFRHCRRIEQDPYWVSPHRSVRLLTWGKALEDVTAVL